MLANGGHELHGQLIGNLVQAQGIKAALGRPRRVVARKEWERDGHLYLVCGEAPGRVLRYLLAQFGGAVNLHSGAGPQQHRQQARMVIHPSPPRFRVPTRVARHLPWRLRTALLVSRALPRRRGHPQKRSSAGPDCANRNDNPLTSSEETVHLFALPE